MSDVLAIVPARIGSKGVPLKNFTALAGISPTRRALLVAAALGIRAILTSDADILELGDTIEAYPEWVPEVLTRSDELSTDTTPMLDVIRHVLDQVPGPEEQIICLLQPTQPLRQPKHIIKAINLLEASMADSVVSVVQLPLTHAPDFQLRLTEGTLRCWEDVGWLDGLPTRRQAAEQTYIRDGTVYVFWRRTLSKWGSMYGPHVVPLIIPPEETQPLDTPADWAEAERRLR